MFVFKNYLTSCFFPLSQLSAANLPQPLSATFCLHDFISVGCTSLLWNVLLIVVTVDYSPKWVYAWMFVVSTRCAGDNTAAQLPPHNKKCLNKDPHDRIKKYYLNKIKRN